MKSRTSFFDKTLYKKNLTRFCPVWLIYLIEGIFTALSTVSYSSYPGATADNIADTFPAIGITQGIYAGIVALCLFGDLFNSRMCNAIHALPVRREQLFVTNLLSGLSFSLIPNTAIVVIMLARLGSFWYIGLLWLLVSELCFLFFFALAAFCAMSTGSRFAMASVYTLLNFLGILIIWFINTFYAPLLPGLHLRGDFLVWFSPMVKLSSLSPLVIIDANYSRDIYSFDGFSSDWWYIGVLMAAALALLWLAVFLYRRRDLEKAGEFIVFKSFLPFFSIILTFTVAAISRGFGSLFEAGDLFAVIGIAIGYIGGEMLTRRTVKVFQKKTAIRLVIIAAVFIGSLFLTALDPLNRVSWLPETEQVEAVVLSDDYDYDPNEELWYGYVDSAEITEPERIAQLIQLHRELLEKGMTEEEYYLSHDPVDAIHLSYKMSNGTTVERRYYYLRDSEIARRVEQFYNMPEFVIGYRDWESFIAELEWASIDSYVGEGGWTELEGQSARELLTAVKKDCEAGWLQYSPEDCQYMINISGKNIFVTSTCANTLSVIHKYMK